MQRVGVYYPKVKVAPTPLYTTQISASLIKFFTLKVNNHCRDKLFSTCFSSLTQCEIKSE